MKTLVIKPNYAETSGVLCCSPAILGHKPTGTLGVAQDHSPLLDHTGAGKLCEAL